MNRLLSVWIVAVAAGLAMLGWAFWYRPRRVMVRRYELELPHWPAGLDCLKIAILTDLHAGGPHVDARKVARIVSRVNGECPDLVALLGDYVDADVPGGDPVSPESVAAALSRSTAPLGIFAVMGNHDLVYGAERVRGALRDAGIRLLENDAVELVHGGAALELRGLADPQAGPEDAPRARSEDTGRGVLLLAHSPDVFPGVPNDVSLTLAGHTHGGQVDLPVVRDRTIPSRFGGRYRSGLIVEDDRHLFVSPGIGTSRLPVRLLAAPEVSILLLHGSG